MRLGQEEQAREEQAAAEAAQVKEDARLAKEQAKADEKAAREAEKDNRPCGGKIDRRQRRRKSGQECGRKSWSKPCPRTLGNFF